MPVFRSRKASADKLRSIESLFATMEGPLLAYAYRITSEEETAQDIVQEAFLKYQKSESKVESPSACLYRTVHNLGINIGKRRSKEVSLEERKPESHEACRDDAEALPNEALEKNDIIQLARSMASA